MEIANKKVAAGKSAATSVKDIVPNGQTIFLPDTAIVKAKSLPVRTVNKDFVSELVADISRNGLDVPLIVWGGEKSGTTVPTSDGKRIDANFLIAGNHRLTALRQIKQTNPSLYAKLFPKGIPVLRRICPLPEAMFIQLRENVQRTDMSPEQVLPVVQELIKTHKLKQKEIAARIGKSVGWVSQVLEIADELGEEGTEALGKGELSFREARSAAKEVKKEKKDGKTPDVKEKLKAAVAKTKMNKTSKKAAKKTSLAVLHDRFTALPTKTSIGRKLQILEDVVLYTLGKIDQFPEELAEKEEEDGDDE